MYLISKLLMNSLFGKFGMKSTMPVHEIIKNKDIDKFVPGLFIKDIVQWDNGFSLVSYIPEYQLDDLFHDDEGPNAKVSIASAITA